MQTATILAINVIFLVAVVVASEVFVTFAACWQLHVDFSALLCAVALARVVAFFVARMRTCMLLIAATHKKRTQYNAGKPQGSGGLRDTL